MNRKQYDELESNEMNLRTALHADYVRVIPDAKLDILIRIYKELGFTEHVKRNCGSCIIKMCKRIAKPYYEFREIIENKKLLELVEDIEQQYDKLADSSLNVVIVDPASPGNDLAAVVEVETVKPEVKQEPPKPKQTTNKSKSKQHKGK